VEIRASQGLRLWHDVGLALVRQAGADLSLRQMAILCTVYLEAPPHTVRGLAEKLGVTKPAITRALDTMGGLKLLSRRRDEKDRRNVVIQRTVEGALYLESLGDLIAERARDLPR
jgi:DNA-binding MarR family transcriptional regulator